MRLSPKNCKCPSCNADFAFRKDKRCPACGVLLLIASDKFSDFDEAGLKNFWMWDVLKRKWMFIRDWQQNLRDAVNALPRPSSARTIADVIAFPRKPTKPD